MTESRDSEARKWMDDAEEALNRVSEAVRTAWEGTRETRMSALEAAKEAAAQLGKAIDQGMDKARETWDSSKAQQAEEKVPDESSAPEPAPAMSDEDSGDSEEE